MSFLTTHPEALTFAAGQLQALGASMSAENAGAAAPTTAIAPAAADEVSALQAGIFTTYGTLYQQIAAEAQAMHEQFVSMLGMSAGSYAATEASNASATSAASAAGAASAAAAASPAATTPIGTATEAITTVATLLGGPVTSFGGQPFSFSGNAANFLSFETGNWASAMSCLIGLAPLGVSAPEAAEITGEVAAEAAGAAAGLESSTALVGPAAGGSMMAGMGQAAATGGLSVPPSWATGTLASSMAPAGTATAGWTTAAPQAAPVAAMPGMPGAGAAGRSAGLGAPRYGLKPIVMPKPAVV